jgi:hypothetical protein
MAPFILINKLNGTERPIGNRETNSPPFTERVQNDPALDNIHRQLNHVRTNPKRLHFAVVSDTRGSSVRKLLHGILLTPTILRRVPHFFFKSVHPIPEPLTSYPVLPSTPRPPLCPLHILQLAASYAAHNSEQSSAKRACFATPSPDC